MRYTSAAVYAATFIFLILKNYTSILVSSRRRQHGHLSSLRGDAVVRTWILVVFGRDRPEQADVSVVQLLNWPEVVFHVLQHNTRTKL
jgi:hypothetical protein